MRFLGNHPTCAVILPDTNATGMDRINPERDSRTTADGSVDHTGADYAGSHSMTTGGISQWERNLTTLADKC